MADRIIEARRFVAQGHVVGLFAGFPFVMAFTADGYLLTETPSQGFSI